MRTPDSTVFDASLWPLLVVRHPGVFSSREHEEFLDTLTLYLRRREKHVLLMDLSRCGLVPLDQRWRKAEWFEKNEALMRETLLGRANVVTSPVAQLSLSVILHFKPIPVPHITVSDLGSAVAWTAERLQEAGLAFAASRVREHFLLGPTPREPPIPTLKKLSFPPGSPGRVF
jgi:hypothetical protein